MKIRINKRITIFLLLVFICIISIPSALSMYREKQTKTLKTTITHPNYTLTADANGGSIPATTGWTGTGLTATKQVTYGHEYGNLPTPIRNGYTFKGWNGKNLFNEMKKGVRIYPDNGEETADQDYASTNYISVDFSNGNSYYLSGLTNKLRSFIAVYDANKEFLGRTSGITRTEILLDSNSIQAFKTFDVTQAKYIRIQQYFNGTNSIDEIDNLSIQLEEGTTATTFEPYYVTSSTNVTQDKNHTLKAIWEKKEATFLPGSEFNAKIKQLAGNQNATYETEDLNITSIVRSNNLTIMPTDDNVMSTSDSEYPIYAWFDSNNGTIYYYTEALNPYMNSNSGNMFRNLKNLTSLDLSEFDTKYTTYMHSMFYNCLKLSSLNISNFDTSNVINMGYMFGNCKKLVTLDLSNFDMSRVTSVEGMFNNFGNPSELQTLKTPKVYPTDSNVKITLPKTMIDASGNEYTEINNTNQTEIMLYTPATFIDGWKFNLRIKQLAGNQIQTYGVDDNNIRRIVRSNNLTIMPIDENVVSTTDSYTPIYVWFDSNDGTIYYYTEALNPYMNANAHSMFRQLVKVTSIDLGTINTSKATHMAAMFYASSSLTNLDLSTFDMSGITSSDKVASIFGKLTSLTSLKTPKVYPTDSSVKITLPKLMIDSNGNEYTELNSSSPTETMLYTPATFLPGQEFNAKIKQLAGNQDATYETADTNITSIVRSNTLSITPTSDNIVSTSDSNTPIYAWFDNGILYYYSENTDIYMNKAANSMFRNIRNCTSINISTIKTTTTTNMYGMFSECRKIESIDISDFNIGNLQNTGYMFYDNRNLRSLDLSNFDMSNVTNTSNMLTYTISLESLKTPKAYPTDSSVKITLPKLMVDASDNEYTELNSSSPTETWLYTPATFLPGTEFNAKIKQLAGNENATYNTTDTNITSIVRSDTLGITPTDDNIVSTSDSNTPIYAWYDNGTIYYYTEEENPYMNTNASFMFYYLLNVTSIDISDVKTINTNNMYSMFYNCRSLENIDVSNFNTSKVTNMSQMFAVNRALTTLDLSSFNTSNVTEMAAMFRYCNSLKELDLSKFDMTKVTNANLMITDLPVLESLKTPKVYPSEAVIQMPKTLYDPNGNAWAVLDSSAPTETWLHKMVCKRATTLHTETCSQTSDSLYCSGAGYKVGGSKNTSTITYGSLGTNASTLNGGDAFTCDVNGDGTFNETTERFYYVGDYYNTTTKEFETDTGVLVYYNNVSGGTPSNTATSVYDSSGENWHGPVTAITQLPTTSQWTNISLKNNTRAILDNSNNNTTTGGTLPSDFSYSGYSARLLTMQEINNATGKTGIYKRLDVIAPYLFENTKYSIDSLNNRWWIETAISNDISCDTLYVSVNESSGYTNGIYGDSVLGLNGVRPAIEVNKNFLNKKVNAYLITYDTNGGSENTTQIVTVGDSLESLSVPTKEGYTFNGWYTATSGGEEVTTATVPTATTTYYAHWTPINYNITYDLDGGEVGTANPTTYNPDSNSITLNNPTKTGYTFLGWTGSNGNTPQTTVTIPVGSTGDKAYIANWQVNNYTFTFNANGGSVSTTTKQVTYGQTYTDLPTPTRSDYTFKGWYTDLTGTSDYINYGREYMYEDKISIHTSAYMDDWSAFNATILSSTESGGWSIASSGGKIYFGSYDKGVGYKSFNSTSTIASLSSGWHDFDLVFDGTNVKGYVDRTLVGTSATYVSGKIGYNATNSIFIGAEATSSPTTPSGGNFLGNIGNIIIKNDDTLISGTTYNTITAPAQNLTLHAIWEPVDYEITYDLQGGTLASSNPATYNVETNTFTLNNPTQTGYTFLGWTGSNGNTPEVNVTIPVGSYGDKAYVAHFSPIYEPETRIRSLNTIGTTIADDDPDSNLRFIGANPNNYVSFNGQKWRIIGVFDGKLKIIGDSIGKYSWDTSRNTVNKGYGINQWGPSGTYTGADLMKLLNPGYSSNTDLKCNNTYSDGNCGTNDDSDYTTGLVNNSLYWNAESGYCYNSGNYQTTTCDFTTTGLQSNTARNMIDNATWYLGTPPSSDNCYDGRMTASYLYNMERSNNNGSTTWQGKVGLLYPSDYAYATGGGTTYNRNTCLTVNVGYVSNSSISNWDNTYTDCKNNDWLFTSNWTHSISARPIATNNRVFSIYTSGFITDYYASYSENVRPVVYLKSSIKLTSGDGSYNSPFNLIDTE